MKIPHGWLHCCGNYPWISSTARYTRKASFGMEMLVQIHQFHRQRRPLPRILLKAPVNQIHWSLCPGSMRRTVFRTSLWQTGWKQNRWYHLICMRDLQRKQLPESLARQRCQDWFILTETLSWLQKHRSSRKAPKGLSPKSGEKKSQSSWSQFHNSPDSQSSLHAGLANTSKFQQPNNDKQWSFDSVTSDSSEMENSLTTKRMN